MSKKKQTSWEQQKTYKKTKGGNQHKMHSKKKMLFLSVFTCEQKKPGKSAKNYQKAKKKRKKRKTNVFSLAGGTFSSPYFFSCGRRGIFKPVTPPPIFLRMPKTTKTTKKCKKRKKKNFSLAGGTFSSPDFFFAKNECSKKGCKNFRPFALKHKKCSKC